MTLCDFQGCIASAWFPWVAWSWNPVPCHKKSQMAHGEGPGPPTHSPMNSQQQLAPTWQPEEWAILQANPPASIWQKVSTRKSTAHLCKSSLLDPQGTLTCFIFGCECRFWTSSHFAQMWISYPQSLKVLLTQKLLPDSALNRQVFRLPSPDVNFLGVIIFWHLPNNTWNI